MFVSLPHTKIEVVHRGATDGRTSKPNCAALNNSDSPKYFSTLNVFSFAAMSPRVVTSDTTAEAAMYSATYRCELYFSSLDI